MKRTASAFLLAFVAAVFAVPAMAVVVIPVSPQRTFVSTTGSDTNPCSRTQPCRNFGPAIAAVAAGGEVVALDSGGYGRITLIDKSVSIIAPVGIHAAITASTGDGITINASNIVVLLRGLFLTGLGGYTGINVANAKSLTFENGFVGGFDADGIYFAPQAVAEVILSNDVIRKNGNTGMDIVSNGDLVVRGRITHTRFEDNGANGLAAFGETRVVVDDTTAMNNYYTGFNAGAPTGQIALMLLEHCVSFDNADGIGAHENAEVVLSNSTVFNNFINAFHSDPCCIRTRQNNTVYGNSGDSSFDSQLPPN